MSGPQLTESEVAEALKIRNIVRSIAANPEARALLNRAHKTVDPTVSIPEIDAAKPVLDEMAKLREEISTMRTESAAAKQANEDAKRMSDFEKSWSAQKAKLRNDDGYTDEGITKVEQFAQEKGIPDLSAAAAYFEKLNPPQIIHPGARGLWDGFTPSDENADKDDIKRLMAGRGDDPQAVDNMLRRALADVRQRR